MRNKFADTFLKLSRKDKKLCIVVADISPAGAMNDFRLEFPERFVNTGVAEQTMIGMVAGMAMQGLKPFAYTIATFTLYRPFEFVRNDLCYQNLPVTIVGIGGGVTYSTLGSTHHAQEDISIANSIPNMKILAPCDPYETEAATIWSAKKNFSPTYLRLGKAGEKNLSIESDVFQFGKLRYLKKGKDICIIGYGPILKLAFNVSNELSKKGKDISIISNHTIKPLDVNGILDVLNKYKKVLVLEEMSAFGGLSNMIKSIGFDNKTDCEIDTVSLKDRFIHCYGSHQDILSSHNITEEVIYEKLK